MAAGAMPAALVAARKLRRVVFTMPPDNTLTYHRKVTLRRSEWALVAFFTYTSLLACLLPVSASFALAAIGANAGIVAGCFLLSWGETLRHHRLFNIARDWYPIPFILLAHREMGWFAPVRHNYRFEQVWVVWDKVLLNQLGLKALVEFAGPVLPSILEIAYLSFYAVPLSAVAVFYVYGARARVDRFLFQLLLGIFLAYLLFPFFPSEPPRTVFPGQDLPSRETVFRTFNLWILGDWGIHTGVFPSIHVTGAFSAAFGVMRLLSEPKWVGRFLLVLAVLIATATVYGRYHYAADALAGLATAGVALVAARAVDRRSGL
jgi:membrane-associated phospholipid phosphatase